MKLTKRLIDSLKYKGPTPRRHVEWDDLIPGFGVRIYPTGRKAFVLSYRTNGRKRLMSMGDYGTLTLVRARDLARQHLAELIQGDDPLEKRQKALRGETIKDLCSVYMERHAKPRKKSWKDDERYLNKYVIPLWGNLKATALKRADIAALHTKTGQAHPYAANRVVEIIAKMYRLAQTWGFVEDGMNPVQGIEHFKEKKRDRWVTPEELPRLAQAIDQEPNLYARYALWLYLLTGLRKNELLTARWDFIDWSLKELRLPETKADRIHYLPLSGAALNLLREIPRMEGNPYILPGKMEGKHLVNVDKPWRRVRQMAGVEDVRLHDLRRTVGSWLAQSGNSLHLIGRVLNHSDQKSTAVYARFGQDHVREALEDHGNRIMGAAGKLPKADIIKLKGK